MLLITIKTVYRKQYLNRYVRVLRRQELKSRITLNDQTAHREVGTRGETVELAVVVDMRAADHDEASSDGSS